MLDLNDNDVDKLTRHLFKVIDQNMDDVLTERELRTFVQDMNKEMYPGRQFDEKAFQRGFRKLDVNHDGFLVWEEVRKVVKKYATNNRVFAASIIPESHMAL